MGSIILSTLNRAPEELLGVGASLGGVSTRTRTTPETITVLSSALGDTVLHEHPSGVSDEGIPHFTCDTTALRYARIEAQVTVAGAAGATLRLQYRVLSVGGTWLSAGGSGGEVAVTLSATGDLVVGGSVPLTALCTGDCEFRVVAVDGDGSASPCIGNLYVKFMDIPLPASTAIPEPPVEGCNSGLSALRLWGDDFCVDASKEAHHARLATYTSDNGTYWYYLDDVGMELEPEWASWDFLTDHTWNGGHHARSLTIPADPSSEPGGYVYLPRLAWGYSTENTARITDAWIRARIVIPPGYLDASTGIPDQNRITLLDVDGSQSEGPELVIGREYQKTTLGLADAAPLVLGLTKRRGVGGSVASESLGEITSVLSSGVMDLVVRVRRAEDAATYRCEVWLGPSGGTLTKRADYEQTIVFGGEFTLSDLTVMGVNAVSGGGVEQTIQHLEIEIVDGSLHADPFGVYA